MKRRVSTILLECVFDLGVTIAYATLAGLIIVAVVASDDGPPHLLATILYASLLPGAVIVLIGMDASLRIFAEYRERRALRRSDGAPRREIVRTLG